MVAKGITPKKLVKGRIERGGNNNNFVDFVIVCLRSNQENVNISMQNLSKVSKCEGF